MVDKITDLRGKGREAELCVKWQNGTESWQRLNVLKAEVPSMVAEYALHAKKLNDPGWKWAQEYINDVEIIEVRSHCLKGKKKKQLKLRCYMTVRKRLNGSQQRILMLISWQIMWRRMAFPWKLRSGSG